MSRDWNLPPGCTTREIEGEEMPYCKRCQNDVNELVENQWTSWPNDVCDDCARELQRDDEDLMDAD